MSMFRSSTPVRSFMSGLALASLVLGQAQAGIKDELKVHLAELADPDARARERAVMHLWDMASGGRGIELALPGIVSAVSDSDPQVRGLACHSLGIAGNTLPGAYLGELRSAIFPLSRALLDKEPTVREQAVFALASVAGRLDKEEDLLALLPLSLAVDQLGRVGELKDPFKGQAGTIRQALDSLQKRVDEFGERMKE